LEEECFNSDFKFYLIVAKEHLTTHTIKDEIEQQLKKIFRNDDLSLKRINTSSKPCDGLLYIDIDKELNTNSKYKFGIASTRIDHKKLEILRGFVMNGKPQSGAN
jgi:hypothetical protein